MPGPRTNPRACRHFAATLRALRRKRGLSQTQFAKRVGLTNRSHVSRLETRERCVSLSTVERIAAALDLSQDTADTLYLAAGFVPPRHFASGAAFTALVQRVRGYGE